MTEPDLTPDPGYAGPAGPFETEDDARTHPAVRAVYEASHASSRRGVMDEQNRRLLEEACAAAGVGLGAYDRRILGWLANYEPQTCMVIAGLIARAHQAGDRSAPPGPDQRIVSFDLMPKEPDHYFVLTEALRDFAGRQRAVADGLEDGDYESRIRLAETAQDALEQIEEALTPSTIQAIVAASIDEHGAAALAEQEARLTQHQSAPEAQWRR